MKHSIESTASACHNVWLWKCSDTLVHSQKNKDFFECVLKLQFFQRNGDRREHIFKRLCNTASQKNRSDVCSLDSASLHKSEVLWIQFVYLFMVNLASCSETAGRKANRECADSLPFIKFLIQDSVLGDCKSFLTCTLSFYFLPVEHYRSTRSCTFS